MTEFKEGDRVRYTGNFTSYLKGDIGTVVAQTDSNNVSVRWDNNPRRNGGVMPENLTLIKQVLQPGVADEFSAIRTAFDALAPLDTAAQERAVSYLISRFDLVI